MNWKDPKIAGVALASLVLAASSAALAHGTPDL
jgi:hypothetical protein